MAPRPIVDPGANARCVIGVSPPLINEVAVRHTSLRAGIADDVRSASAPEA